MELNKKKVLLSVMAATLINAAAVLFMEYVIGNTTAEVAVSSVIGIIWIAFVQVFCRKKSDS